MNAALRAADAWWMAPGEARTLGRLRVLVCGFALGYLLIRMPAFFSAAAFDGRRFEPAGLAVLLDEPLPVPLARALILLAAVAGAAACAGWRYRWTGPAFALLFLWVTTYRNSWGQVFHTENLLVLHVIVLAMAPAAAALSLDARRRPPPAAGVAFGWPVRLMSLLTVITYVLAGVAKLREAGFGWATHEVLRNHVAYDNLRKLLLGDTHSEFGGWLVRHGEVFGPLAVITLVVELGAPLALSSRRVAWLWVAAAWLFHIGILAAMAIVFPYQLSGIAYASFLAGGFPWRKPAAPPAAAPIPRAANPATPP